MQCINEEYQPDCVWSAYMEAALLRSEAAWLLTAVGSVRLQRSHEHLEIHKY